MIIAVVARSDNERDNTQLVEFAFYGAVNRLKSRHSCKSINSRVYRINARSNR